jgi:Mrp family chromosome partitioning ATPase
MDNSTRMVGGPKRLLQRRAALIAWVTVLAVPVVVGAVWVGSDDRTAVTYLLVVGVGLIGGLALGVAFAYVWDRHAGRLKRASDVGAVTGLPVLGRVPAMHLEAADRADAASHPAYGFVAADLADALRASGANCLLITSPTRGAGRTTTAVSLATLLAAEGFQTALVAADPSGGGVDEVLGLERRPGLTEVLGGTGSLESVLRPGGMKGLVVLTAGGPSDEVLGQRLDRLAGVLDRLIQRVDLVVIDAPPVLDGLDTVLLAREADLVLLVVDVRHGKRSDAALAVALLGHVQDRLVGCVANDPGPRRYRPSRGAPAAAPKPVPTALAGLAAVGTRFGARLRRASGAAAGVVGTGVGAAAGVAGEMTRTARARLISTASPRALRRHPWSAVIASALAVAIVVSTMWWLNHDGSTEAHDGPAARDTSPAAAPPSQEIVAAAMDECRSTWKAQGAPLEAAKKSLQQWQVHVTTMNHLVAGKITLDQASAFWERTRKQAVHRVHRFHNAENAYQAGSHSCRTPDVASTADARLAALTACQRNIERRADVLRAARVAIDTWHHHVIDMNRLRAGALAPARAIRLWNKYWKQGVAELHHYRSQLRETKGQPCNDR